jgi:hypothetical protein
VCLVILSVVGLRIDIIGESQYEIADLMFVMRIITADRQAGDAGERAALKNHRKEADLEKLVLVPPHLPARRDK